MNLLVILLVVVVIVALAMWAVYYIPFPPGSPPFIKPMLYVIILIAGIIFILFRSGVVNATPLGGPDAQHIPQAKAYDGGSGARPELR